MQLASVCVVHSCSCLFVMMASSLQARGWNAGQVD